MWSHLSAINYVPIVDLTKLRKSSYLSPVSPLTPHCKTFSQLVSMTRLSDQQLEASQLVQLLMIK